MTIFAENYTNFAILALYFTTPIFESAVIPCILYVINEEYITNIYNINNELKQTYNISINTGSTSNDSNTDD
jgi:hypothetical protein